MALGISCVLGVVLSFAAVVRGKVLASRRQMPHADRFERLVEATTNRDFSVLLLILAPLQALEWFVWAAAVGIHLFWIAVLGVQRQTTRRPAGSDRPSP